MYDIIGYTFLWVLVIGLVLCLAGFTVFMIVCIIQAIKDLRGNK